MIGDPDDLGDTYSFTYPDDDSYHPAMAVIEAVSWVKGEDASQLEPLENFIDTEALDALFEKKYHGNLRRSSSSEGLKGPQVSFEYEGLTVTLQSENVLIEKRS